MAITLEIMGVASISITLNNKKGMVMDSVEARLKMAEIAASMVEAHVQASPGNYSSKDDVSRAFNKVFDAIYRDFLRVAPKPATKSAPKPIDKS
ncbi:TPA: hypothetical protein ACT3KO_001467 [Raoultella ornithinolytica]